MNEFFLREREAFWKIQYAQHMELHSSADAMQNEARTWKFSEDSVKTESTSRPKLFQ